MIPASRPMRSIWKTTDRGSVPSSRPKCRVRACEERLENQRADQTDSCLNLFPAGRKNACFFLPAVLYYRSRLKSRGVPNLRTIKSRKFPRKTSGTHTWGISTVGSARHSHCRGQGFDSPMLHKNKSTLHECFLFLSEHGESTPPAEDNATHWRADQGFDSPMLHLKP